MCAPPFQPKKLDPKQILSFMMTTNNTTTVKTACQQKSISSLPKTKSFTLPGDFVLDSGDNLISKEFKRARTPSGENLIAGSLSEPRASNFDYPRRHSPAKKSNKNPKYKDKSVKWSNKVHFDVYPQSGSLDGFEEFRIKTPPSPILPQDNGFVQNLLFGKDGALKVGLEGETLKSVNTLLDILKPSQSAPTEDQIRGGLNEFFHSEGVPKETSGGLMDQLFGSSSLTKSGLVKDIVLLSVFTGVCLKFCFDPNKETFALIVGFGVVIYFFSNVTKNVHFLRTLINFVSNIKFSNNIQSQSGKDDFDSYSTGINLLLSSFVLCTSGKNLPSDILKTLGSFDRAKKSMSDIMFFVVGLFEKIVNWIRVECLDMPSLRFLSSNNARIDAFFKKASTIYDKQRHCELYETEETYGVLRALVGQGKNMFMELPKDECTSGARALLQQEINRLTKMMVAFEESHPTLKGFRMEPVSMFLRGAAGVGKSVIMHHITHAFCASVLDDEKYKAFQSNPAEFIYNRFFETKYWDKYSLNSIVTMFDDFGQARDVAGDADNEIMNWFRAVNCFKMDLHMAKIEDKGNVAFNSKLVIATTNLQNFSGIESIRDKLALLRRVAIDVLVVPKKEYCTVETQKAAHWARRFDPSKMPDSEEVTIETAGKKDTIIPKIINPYMQDFYPLDRQGQPTGEAWDFLELVKRMVAMYKRNEAWYLAQKKGVDETEAYFRNIEKADSGIKAQAKLFNFNFGAQMENVESDDSGDESDYDESIAMRAPQLRLFPNHIKRIVEREIANIDNLEPTLQAATILEVMKIAKCTYVNYDDSKNYHWSIVLASLCLDREEFVTKYFSGNHRIRSMWLEDVVIDPKFLVFSLPVDGMEEILEGSEKAHSTWKEYMSKLWDSIKNPIVEAYSGALSFLKENQGIITLCLSIFGAVFASVLLTGGTMTLVGYIFPSWKDIDIEGQSKNYHKETRDFEKKKTISPSALRALRGGGNTGQSGGDSSGYDLIKKVVKTSLFTLRVQDDPDKKEDQWIEYGSVLFVRDTIALMPLHFITKLQARVDENPAVNQAKFSLTGFGSQGKAKIQIGTLGDLLDNAYGDNLVEQDLCLVKFPKHICQPHVDRVANFATDSDIANIMKSHVSYVIPKLEDGDVRMNTGYGTIFGRQFDVVDNEGLIQTYTVKQSFQYKGFTREGDCGSPFCVLNSKIQGRKIYGIHVAGKPDVSSYSALITREMLEAALKEVEENFKDIIITEPFDEKFTAQSAKDVNFDQFNVFGKLSEYPSTCSNTQIIPSKLFNTYTTTDLRPALLYKKGDIDPVSNALKKYCGNHTYVTPQIFSDCVRELRDFIYKRGNDRIRIRARVLSVWEAVYGIEGTEHFRGIPRATSSGYPMNVNSNKDYKKGLFPPPVGRLREDDPTHIFWELFDLVQIDLNKMKSGIRPFYAFTDFLKDELRPEEKVKTGKTRLISGCPLIYTIISRMYNQSFDAYLMSNRIWNGSCVGINPYSTEWDELVKYLSAFDESEKSSLVGAGDFSAFDGDQLVTIQMMTLELVQDYYAREGSWSLTDKEEQERVRSVLWCEVTNARHINDGMLYEWFGGLSSGHPETVIINCIVNQLLFRVCWKMIIGPIHMFNDNVHLAVYGDDVVYSVNRRFRNKFNDINIGVEMENYGMKYTTELKEIATVGFRPIDTVEFLKRSFYFSPKLHRWIAPLRLEVVLNIPMWTKKGTYSDEIVCDNVVVAIRELSLHDTETFNIWRPRIVEAFHRYYCHTNPCMNLETEQGFIQALVCNSEFVDLDQIPDLEEDSHSRILSYNVDLFN